MSNLLEQRFKTYESNTNYVLLNKVPLIIKAKVKNFNKMVENLPKPSYNIIHIMANTMLYAMKEIQGGIFGFTFNDEIIFVIKNDQNLDSEPWLQNKIQKIVSQVASLLTRGFDKSLSTLDANLDLLGEAIFDVQVFPIPHIGEICNYLIWRQLVCYQQAVQQMAYWNISKKSGIKTANKLLFQKSLEEKKIALLEECCIELDLYYHASYLRGISLYRIPTLIKDNLVKDKWTLNFETPSFIQDKDFLYCILLNNKDVMRVK